VKKKIARERRILAQNRLFSLEHTKSHTSNLCIRGFARVSARVMEKLFASSAIISVYISEYFLILHTLEMKF